MHVHEKDFLLGGQEKWPFHNTHQMGGDFHLLPCHCRLLWLPKGEKGRQMGVRT